MNLEHIVIENIKRIRKEKHITQERLAEYCETSVSYIGLMETYKNIPKLSTIERIAAALNVPVLELFSEKDELATLGNDNVRNNDDEIRRQKLLGHLKDELLEKIKGNIDEIFQRM